MSRHFLKTPMDPIISGFLRGGGENINAFGACITYSGLI